MGVALGWSFFFFVYPFSLWNVRKKLGKSHLSIQEPEAMTSMCKFCQSNDPKKYIYIFNTNWGKRENYDLTYFKKYFLTCKNGNKTEKTRWFSANVRHKERKHQHETADAFLSPNSIQIELTPFLIISMSSFSFRSLIIPLSILFSWHQSHYPLHPRPLIPRPSSSYSLFIFYSQLDSGPFPLPNNPNNGSRRAGEERGCDMTPAE